MTQNIAFSLKSLDFGHTGPVTVVEGGGRKDYNENFKRAEISHPQHAYFNYG